MRRCKNWDHKFISWKYQSENLFYQFFPEYRVPLIPDFHPELFSGWWRSIAATALDLILVEVDSKCQSVGDTCKSPRHKAALPRPQISKKLSMYTSLHKENPHSAKDFKQKWKVLPHYATESLKYIYSNKIIYIYNIFSAEFHIKSNIFEIKYEVPPKIVPRLIHSTSTSWEQSKHLVDSSGKSPRRQDWEWGARSDQLCAAGGVICTHRKLFGCLFLCHFPKS